MNKIEILQKEAREKILASFFPVSSESWYPSAEKEMLDLITHIYLQAIEDAKGVMPLLCTGTVETGAMTKWGEGWNDCRAEAITALDKLKGV